MRQLHRLTVSDVRDLPYIPYKTRVGRHHPRHVRPYLEHLSVNRGSDDRRRVIRTAAAERRCVTFGVGCNKARENM